MESHHGHRTSIMDAFQSHGFMLAQVLQRRDWQQAAQESAARHWEIRNAGPGGPSTLRSRGRSGTATGAARAVAAVAAIVALLGAVGVGRATLGTAAQENASGLTAHPLVGTWMAMTPFGASPETFAADGSFVAGPPIIESGDDGVMFLGPGIGVWQSIGPRSGRATFVQALGDAAGTYTGTLTIDAHLEVSDDGRTFVDDSPETTLTFRDAENAVVRVIAPYKAGGDVPPVTAVRMAVGAPGFPVATSSATPGGRWLPDLRPLE